MWNALMAMMNVSLLLISVAISTMMVLSNHFKADRMSLHFMRYLRVALLVIFAGMVGCVFWLGLSGLLAVLPFVALAAYHLEGRHE